MPRKAFIADFEAAKLQNIPNITDISRGESDEDINVTFLPENGTPIEVCLLVQPDLGSYPTETFFMIFSQTSDPPPNVAAALEDISGFSHAMKIPELITKISSTLRGILATGARNAPILIDGSDVDMLDGTDEEEQNDSEDYEEYGGFSEDDEPANKIFHSTTLRIKPESVGKINQRIRHDIRAAKFAGFSVGILNGMKADSVSNLVSLSIRVAKLGLSEEAIQAWDLEPQQYIVLLLRYSSGYKTFDTVIADAAKRSDIEFRIGVCNNYKPTVLEALAAFTDMTKKSTKQDKSGDTPEDTVKSGFANLFISSSLNDFINSQFISLLKMRYSLGVGWDGAKKFMSDRAGRVGDHTAELPSDYYEENIPAQPSLPDVVVADHLTEIGTKELSFPLIFAQFALRYLTRCTEFCLVCHDRISEEFGALKPYVCTKPLCLYQYMSLGFGPSVEHEILTQPYVVDLLVSFCYISALQRKLREYPTGMSLNVPPINDGMLVTSNKLTPLAAANALRSGVVTPVDPIGAMSKDTGMDVTFDAGHQEVMLGALTLVSPVRVGDWVTISTAVRTMDHYRVDDISLFPKIKLSSTAVTRAGDDFPSIATPAATPPPTYFQSAKMTIYNHNFDEMMDHHKAETIVMALDTLPSITTIRAYLVEQSRSSEPNLRAWKDRISPAALGILRWIIASNRSCIVQVDRCPGQTDEDVVASKVRLNQRVANISDSWVQFRFAQGSPDKEQKFLNALKSQKDKLNAQYPTIFAWHGSPLANWHSIIRHGLDFKEIAHGRAYGNGVYHAQDQNTSIGYAGLNPTASDWHGSSLKIRSAMSLNEIVNCPAEYTSSTPYIVVAQIDWIQCRYLFVQASGAGENYVAANSNKNSRAIDPGDRVVEQDPKYVAKSTLNMPIGVPECAVAISRAFRGNFATTGQALGKKDKKRRKTIETLSSVNLADLATSDSEDVADINFLFTDDEDDSITNEQSKQKDTKKDINLDDKGMPLTDFRPGTLDQSQLPMLEPPSYATLGATKVLTRALKEIVEIQKKTPLHELGWYIDAELINNVYQWIVEFHSFDSSLPLAQDMKATNMTSIVMEVRFGKDFPYSPPFIRVVRPRFLPFMQGGGGHVTAGGAICMELLTNSGWSSVSSLESVLLQVRLAITSLEPKPARLDKTMMGMLRGKMMDYGTGEAIEAYLRACATHGWEVPAGFRESFGQ